MNQKSSVGFILILFTCCQTLMKDEMVARERPFGESVRAPFDDMIRNLPPSEQFLGVIYFDFDDASLSEDAKEELDRIAAAVSEQSGLVIVEGHTEDIYSEDYATRLGYERALAAAEYLRSTGVWDERLLVRSFGGTRPVATSRSVTGRAQNRRAVITLLVPGEGMSGKEAAQVHGKMTERLGAQTAAPMEPGLSPLIQSGGRQQ